MAIASLALPKTYWETFKIENSDLEFLYNHLLELETPQTPQELVRALIDERIKDYARSGEHGAALVLRGKRRRKRGDMVHAGKPGKRNLLVSAGKLSAFNCVHERPHVDE